MSKYKKLGRLMLLDLRRAIWDKIIIVIEITICTLLFAIALSGITGANHINFLYKEIDGLYIQTMSVGDFSESEKQVLIEKIINDNVVGEISIESLSNNRNEFMIVGYNDVMLEKVPIKLSKGNMFSENYITQDYKEIILDKSLSKKFKIGQVISGRELNLLNGEKKYKVIGFLANNYGILDHQYSGVSKNIGITKLDKNTDYLTNKIIFTDNDIDGFLQKYDLLQYKDKENTYIQIYSTKEWLRLRTDSEEQIMSFFIMFLVVAIGVYLSTIISSIVIKYNDNLIFNKNLLKIGTSRMEFLLVKLFNILLITLFCIVLSIILLITIVAPNIAIIAKYATLGAGHIIGSMVAIILSYVTVEIIEVFFMYKNILEERI